MTTHLGRLTYLRPCDASDDAFLYAVFCTTWENEVAALPNQNLVQHVLRIQHIAQERRFAGRYPGHERYVVLEDGEPAGRLYLWVEGSTMQVVDLTILPRFQSNGLGSRILGDLREEAGRRNLTLGMRVPRSAVRVTGIALSLGFGVVGMDDVEATFEWAPAPGSEAPVETSSLRSGADCR